MSSPTLKDQTPLVRCNNVIMQVTVSGCITPYSVQLYDIGMNQLSQVQMPPLELDYGVQTMENVG